MKKYTELKYPDTVYLENEEQWNKINEIVPIKRKWIEPAFYLMGVEGHSKYAYTGKSSLETPYNNYLFSDIIFEENVFKKGYEAQNKFIVGKWYKGWEEDQLYAKYKKHNDYFHFTEFIRKSKGHSFYEGNWELPNNIIEASLEEIQQYLPNNHPDKFISNPLLEEARLRYPIGTKFICLNTKVEAEITSADFKRTITGGLNEYIEDSLAEINGIYHCVFPSAGKWAEIIKSKKESMDAFKEGDKVKTPKGEGIVIAKQEDDDRYLVEHLISIGGHSGSGSSKKWGKNGKDNYCYWYLPENIELLTNIEPYTVGGYIKVTRSYSNIGKIGKITKIVDRKIWTDLDFSATEKAYFIKDSECEWIGMEKPVGSTIDEFNAEQMLYNVCMDQLDKLVEVEKASASSNVETGYWTWAKSHNIPVVSKEKELEFQTPVIIKKRKKSQLITI